MEFAENTINLKRHGIAAFRPVLSNLRIPHRPMLKTHRNTFFSPILLLFTVIFFIPVTTNALGSSSRKSNEQEDITTTMDQEESTTYTGRTMAFDFSDLLGTGDYSTGGANIDGESGTDRIGTLVAFWSIHCSHCIAEIPLINSLYVEWAPRGLLIVGVPQDDRPEDIIRLSNVFEINWPQFFESGSANEKPMTREWGIDVIPTFFLLDEKGVVIDHGFRDLSTTLDQHFR